MKSNEMIKYLIDNRGEITATESDLNVADENNLTMKEQETIEYYAKEIGYIFDFESQEFIADRDYERDSDYDRFRF